MQINYVRSVMALYRMLQEPFTNVGQTQYSHLQGTQQNQLHHTNLFFEFQSWLLPQQIEFNLHNSLLSLHIMTVHQSHDGLRIKTNVGIISSEGQQVFLII